MLKRSLFYHVDKKEDTKVPLKHRGALSVGRNHARSLRKSILKFSFIKIARDARILYHMLLCSCAHMMFKYVVLWYAEEISLSLSLKGLFI